MEILTQDKMAEATKLTQPMISYIAHGQVEPRINTALILRDKFGIPFEVWRDSETTKKYFKDLGIIGTQGRKKGSKNVKSNARKMG